MSDHTPLCSGNKQCKVCLRDLSVLAFSVCKANKDGLETACRDCRQSKWTKTASAVRIKETQTRKAKAKYGCSNYDL